LQAIEFGSHESSIDCKFWQLPGNVSVATFIIFVAFYLLFSNATSILAITHQHMSKYELLLELNIVARIEMHKSKIMKTQSSKKTPLEGTHKILSSWLLHSKAGEMPVIVSLPTLSLPFFQPLNTAAKRREISITLLENPTNLNPKCTAHASQFASILTETDLKQSKS
jgi:hypothetical protein